MYTKAIALGVLTMSSAFPMLAGAQDDYPSRPIRLIVPSAPGGGTDFTARTIGQKLTESIGQTVIVDNRAGAAGNIGVEIAAKSSPDGYTLVMPITSFSINPHLYSKLPFDTVKDFAPVVLASSAPLFPGGEPVGPGEVRGRADHCREIETGQLNYANSGNGTTAHLAGELFKKMAGVDLVSVPYKGGGPAVIDLIAGPGADLFLDDTRCARAGAGRQAARSRGHDDEARESDPGRADRRGVGAARVSRSWAGSGSSRLPERPGRSLRSSTRRSTTR